MIQKVTENLPVLVGLIIIILALYSCAFRRIWRERRERTEAVRKSLFPAEDSEVIGHDKSHARPPC